MDADMVKLLVALALILVSATFAVSGSVPQKEARPAGARKKRERRAPFEVSGAAPPPAEVAALTAPAQTTTSTALGSSRPRIFTGEPGAAEHEPGAGRRAFKLATGLAVMAAIGAVAILALVRAMVEVFQRIGG